MFVVDYGMVRRQRPRRRYWWGAMGFVMGAWLGVCAAHLLESLRLQAAGNAALGMGSAPSVKGEARQGGGS